MRLSSIVVIAVVTSLSLLMTGCYEEPSFQMHEAGQYQGASDPLLKVAGTPDQNERLASRFLAVQTDR